MRGGGERVILEPGEALRGGARPGLRLRLQIFMDTYVYVDGFNFYYRSDVNLASHMVNGGHKGCYKVAVVISDDSDLAAPLRIVRNDLGLVTGILTSKRRPSRSLYQYATFYKKIREAMLHRSQFPNQLIDPKGAFHKPPSW